MRKVKWILLPLLLWLSGCETLQRLAPAGAVALEAAAFSQSVLNFERNYVNARVALGNICAEIPEQECATLRNGDAAFRSLKGQYETLRSNSNGAAQIVVGANEFIALIERAKAAANPMVAVLDRISYGMAPDTHFQYQSVRADWARINGRVDLILAEQDNARRVAMLRELLRIAGQVAVIAVQIKGAT